MFPLFSASVSVPVVSALSFANTCRYILPLALLWRFYAIFHHGMLSLHLQSVNHHGNNQQMQGITFCTHRLICRRFDDAGTDSYTRHNTSSVMPIPAPGFRTSSLQEHSLFSIRVSSLCQSPVLSPSAAVAPVRLCVSGQPLHAEVIARFLSLHGLPPVRYPDFLFSHRIFCSMQGLILCRQYVPRLILLQGFPDRFSASGVPALPASAD